MVENERDIEGITMDFTPDFILNQSDQISKVQCAKSLSYYCRQAWNVVEPATLYLSNWHLDAISDHLTGVINGQILRLLINIPPRFEKSLQAAVFFPTWVWGPLGKPHVRWLFSSYAESLSIRDSVKCRNIINSSWYQRNWGNVFKLSGDQNEKRRFENDKTGYRLATSVSGSNTGEGGDIIIIDDPHNVVDGESDAVRESTLLWFKEVIPSRLNDPKTGAIVTIMQRVHDGDVSGEALKQGGYVHLCLPMEYEPRTMILNPLSFNDLRTTEGELLWPERFGPAEVSTLKTSLGEYAYAGQYQQRPTPRGGGIIKRHWWRYWKPKGLDLPPVEVKTPDGNITKIYAEDLPDQFNIKIQSWDMNFKDTASSAYVVGQAWGQWVANRYLLDQVREVWDFPKTIKGVTDFSFKHPDTSCKYIEDKANGPAVISSLRDKISGLIPVEPDGDKTARASAISYLIEAGNVFIPHPSLFTWVEDFLAELTAFPKSAYKDQTDTCSQALNKLRNDFEAPIKTELDIVAELRGKHSDEYRLLEAELEEEKEQYISFDEL